ERYLAPDGSFDRDRAINGPWSAGIPGLPAGLLHVAHPYGRLPLPASLAPAIRIARGGFPVYERMARGYERGRVVMERDPGTREVFLAGGAPPRVGDLFRQPDLARTLELLAQHGHDGFYRGEVARKLVEGVNAEGGQWTLEELASYTVKEREPVRFRYRGWGIAMAPSPWATRAPSRCRSACSPVPTTPPGCARPSIRRAPRPANCSPERPRRSRTRTPPTSRSSTRRATAPR